MATLPFLGALPFLGEKAAKAEPLVKGRGPKYISSDNIKSVNITISYDLEQVFELGQIALYENPDRFRTIDVEIEIEYKGIVTIMTLQALGDQNMRWDESPAQKSFHNRDEPYHILRRDGKPIYDLLEDHPATPYGEKYELIMIIKDGGINSEGGNTYRRCTISDLKLCCLQWSPIPPKELAKATI
jgi:hypothetical protein